MKDIKFEFFSRRTPIANAFCLFISMLPLMTLDSILKESRWVLTSGLRGILKQGLKQEVGGEGQGEIWRPETIAHYNELLMGI